MRRFREPEDDIADDEDDVPLHHKRAFGSGIKRKRVEFVRAQEPDASIAAAPTKPTTSIGDLYASVVLKESPKSPKLAGENESPDETVPDPIVCPICNLPLTGSSHPHEASLAHQVCLTHSHPPSALDRSRMGLRALAAQGWDPDARQGLGRGGEGMRFPIKVVAKEDTLGVGAKIPENLPKKEEKPKQLSRKEKRELAQKEKLKNERLQRDIFGSVDVERYLRGDGTDG